MNLKEKELEMHFGCCVLLVTQVYLVQMVNIVLTMTLDGNAILLLLVLASLAVAGSNVNDIFFFFVFFCSCLLAK